MSANKFRYVFVIDDDKIQQEMIKDYLKDKYLFEVRAYNTGEDALKDIHLNPEIVVLDYFLNSKEPNAKNGMEIMNLIKQNSPTSNIIIISGQDDINVAVDALQNGASDYIVKGETSFSRLENSINKLGEMHRLKTINKSQKNAILFLATAIIIIILYAIFFK